MKKIDKLVLQAFLGPFILTFVVVVFILLTTQMLRYLDEIFGKGIGLEVLGQFIMHFSVFQTPVAIPLSVMLASLIAFGNLGEHSELTAVKGAGISLIRTLIPIFLFVIMITGVAWYSNSYLVPRSALKAYSLLYDIRQKKPTLDIKEGVFYGGIDNFRIKVAEKDEDGKTLKGLIIYDHSKGIGNTDIILADSGLMYTIMNDRYLKFELYDGHYYSEEVSNIRRNRPDVINPFNRTSFDKSEMVFDLSIFDLKRTREELFSSNRLMRDFDQLRLDIDSLKRELMNSELSMYSTAQQYFPYYSDTTGLAVMPPKIKAFEALKDSLISSANDTLDASDHNKVLRYIDLGDVNNLAQSPKRLARLDTIGGRTSFAQRNIIRSISENNASITPVRSVSDYTDDEITEVYHSITKYHNKNKTWPKVYKTATGLTRQMKSKASVSKNRDIVLARNYNIFSIQYNKVIATAFACVTMFLIGAPLGAIIKKGGLGIPVLVSIIFFIVYYVVTLAAEKQARVGVLEPIIAVWAGNIFLLPIGLLALRQARRDARLLEADYYMVIIEKLSRLIRTKRNPVPV